MIIFKNREEAGKLLAERLSVYKKASHTLVLGLARGGIVVADAIATELELPLNVLVPRKIGAPNQPELAIGAVAEDGEIWLNQHIIEALQISDSWVQEAAQTARKMGGERLAKYRKAAPLEKLSGKTILLVDDGVATGATMLAEIQSLRKQEVCKIIAISPVAAATAWNFIQKLSDEAVCINATEYFDSVSQFYTSFNQVEDPIVLAILKKR